MQTTEATDLRVLFSILFWRRASTPVDCATRLPNSSTLSNFKGRASFEGPVFSFFGRTQWALILRMALKDGEAPGQDEHRDAILSRLIFPR